MFSIQSLMRNLYCRHTEAVINDILSIEHTQVKVESRNKKKAEVLIYDLAEKGDLKIMSFSEIIKLLIHYDMQRAAWAMVKKVEPDLSHDEIFYCLDTALTHSKKLLFHLIAYRFHDKIPQSGFSKLLANALKENHVNEFKFLIRRHPNTPYYIMTIKSSQQLALHRKQPTFILPPSILLAHFNQFDENILIQILQENPQLLYQLRNNEYVEELHPKVSRKVGGLMHFALYNKRSALLQFLLQHQYKVDQPFTLVPKLATIESNSVIKPAFYLIRDLKSYQLMLQFREEDPLLRKFSKESPRLAMQLEYCQAVIMGKLCEVSAVHYANILTREWISDVKGFYRLYTQFNLYHIDMVDILEFELQTKEDKITYSIQRAFKKTIYGIRLLNLALEKNHIHLIKVILSHKKYHTLEVLRLLATYHDLSYFESVIQSLLPDPEAPNRLAMLARTLLAAVLNEPLLILIKLAHSLLNNNATFRSHLSLMKNPQAMILCRQLGMSFTDGEVIQTANFALLTGDRKNAELLLRSSTMWMEFLVKVFLEKNSDQDFTDTTAPVTYLLTDRYMPSYGIGITQAQAKRAQTYHANLAHYFMRKNLFCLNKELAEKQHKRAVFGLAELGMMRRQVAYLARSECAEFFGQIRQSELITPIDNMTLPYFMKFHQKYYLTSHPNVQPLGYAFDEYDVYFNATVHVPINNKSVAVTEYKLSYKDQACWAHTDPNSFNDLTLEIERCIHKIVTNHYVVEDEEDIQLYIKDVAYIHWLLAHATFCFRGSAFITESLCSALLMFRGIMPVISASTDCEALACAEPSDYVNEYGGFFSRLDKMKDANIDGFSLVQGFMRRC